tara:strand:+ start:1195 stop:1719 length:525 start_codon:yes stop_codon:yes gene_type:complete
MPEYKLKINGQLRKVNVHQDMPLLWVLRDSLGLIGAKYGCGIGLCGACTVHVDGVATRSCMLPVAAMVDAEIKTIEGLANGVVLHPVQKAWVEKDVAQCGYCQAGQIMSAVALLEGNTNPSEEDIDLAMEGNYCRCGTYNRIRGAIQVAAAEMMSSKMLETTAVEYWEPVEEHL